MPRPGHGNDKPRRQRGRGLAESGTRMCRGGESDRMSDRAEEPIPGRAAAPTEASGCRPYRGQRLTAARLEPYPQRPTRTDSRRVQRAVR
ncbi:hypothetical protein XHV734_2703 [Xanthomonas hortorum pv. vitians]|nr:hypothetical protein XHV734_2703 [Xanthomonas hortorum pv. vitians]